LLVAPVPDLEVGDPGLGRRRENAPGSGVGDGEIGRDHRHGDVHRAKCFNGSRQQFLHSIRRDVAACPYGEVDGIESRLAHRASASIAATPGTCAASPAECTRDAPGHVRSCTQRNILYFCAAAAISSDWLCPLQALSAMPLYPISRASSSVSKSVSDSSITTG